jgi:antitoxin ParD1/3/4
MLRMDAFTKFDFAFIPRIGIFSQISDTMAKNTSILLGDYFDHFIHEQIKTGKYSSASEVVREALRLFEFEQSKKSELIDALKKGEQSGMLKEVDRTSFLQQMHKKHTSKK